MAKSLAYCLFKLAVDDIFIDFCWVNDPPLKWFQRGHDPEEFQIVIARPQIIVKGISSQNISQVYIPILYLDLSRNKFGNYRLNFGFRGVNGPAAETDLGEFCIEYLCAYETTACL
jgi:hypothetical protein